MVVVRKSPATYTPVVLLIDGGGFSGGEFISRMEEEGLHVDLASTAREGIAMTMSTEPDAILVSSDVPDMSSLAVLRLLARAQGAPVMALSTTDDENDVVLALEMGAVDALTRPWRTRESAARIWTAIRTMHHQGESTVPLPHTSRELRPVVKAGPVEVDLARREVRVRGATVHARPKEIDLLGLLVAYAGRSVPREKSLGAVWPDSAGNGKVLDVHIRRLRFLVEKDAYHPRHIMTVRGYGHRFDP
jgi:DNA-binding response OmpR family regulator